MNNPGIRRTGDLIGSSSAALRRPVFRLTLAVVVAALAIVTLASRASEHFGPERLRSDFAIDYASARAAVHGSSPFTTSTNTLVESWTDESGALPRGEDYPNWDMPFNVPLLMPFAWLPFQLAVLLWVLVSAACFWAAGWIVARTLGMSRISAGTIAFAIWILPVVQYDFAMGQQNGPVLLATVLAWRLLRRGRFVASGAWIGAAVAVKPFPALLLIALRRRTGLVRGAAASFAVLTVVGLVGIGPGFWGDFVATFNGGYRHFAAVPYNASLTARVAAIAGPWLALVVPLAGFVMVGRTRLSFWGRTLVVLATWPIVWTFYLGLVAPWMIEQAHRRRVICVLMGALVVCTPTSHAWIATIGLIAAIVAETVAERSADKRIPSNESTAARSDSIRDLSLAERAS